MTLDANSVVIIIGAVSLLLVNVINATKSNKKLDEIHTLTNSNLAKLQAEMDAMREDNEYFKKIIGGLMAVAPKDAIDKIKGDVGRRVGIAGGLDTSARQDRSHTDSPGYNPPNSTIISDHKESIETLAANLEIKPKEKK